MVLSNPIKQMNNDNNADTIRIQGRNGGAVRPCWHGLPQQELESACFCNESARAGSKVEKILPRCAACDALNFAKPGADATGRSLRYRKRHPAAAQYRADRSATVAPR